MMEATVPIEIIFAAGKIPVDLNNYFVTSPDREELLYEAEKKGLPRTVCSWIKGIYSLFQLPFEKIIFVEGGDCSNTTALREVAEYEGIDFISFHYPLKQDSQLCLKSIENLAQAFDVKMTSVREVYNRLKGIRSNLRIIDRAGYERTGLINSSEIFEFLIGATDFNSNIDEFEARLEDLIHKIDTSVYKEKKFLRIGLCGVPPIFQDLFDYLEKLGAYVVYNEIPIEFAMLEGDQIEDSYSIYTYPYGIFARIKKIKQEIKRRQIDGIIHYVQSFCYRNIENIVLKKEIEKPVLTFEGDSTFLLSPRDKLRLENFVEMLK